MVIFIRNINSNCPVADMNAPYNQQHLQQSGIPLSPSMEPNAPLMSQPQLPGDQPYFHVSI